MASRSIKNRPSIKKKHPWYGFLMVVAVLVAIVAAGGAGMYALGSSWLQDLPDYKNADAFSIPVPSEVVASDKTTQLAKFQLENREPVNLDQISPYVVHGTVATEDERFYEHGGFDLAGIARALIVNLTGTGREGASTITQQLVRNTLLASEMNDISIKRKVREMYLSVKMEQEYSKDDILGMYLNTINYGNATYGIQAASQRYFSKNASDLSLVEAATLIGIPQSPTYNEPINNPENCLTRRNLVLDRMLSNNYISQEEHDAAQAEPLVLNQTIPSNDGIIAYPQFTRYVRNILTDPNGPYKLSWDEAAGGGLTIVTSLDPAMQKQAEATVAAKTDNLPDGVQGALVAIEPSTGYIKAMVGGDTEVNLATGEGTNADHPGRPSGSSFKVFTLVAALEAGISPQTMLDCTSPATIPGTEYGSSGNKPLTNIDNINYGTRSIASAFEVSSNTGFVRLEMSVGLDKVAEAARRMGITSPLNAVPAMTLGTNNVTMLDMSSAYATIANGGMRNDPTPILQIYDGDGNLLVDNTAEQGSALRRTTSKQVISPEIAHAATEVMKRVVSGAHGTGRDAALPSGQVVAAKTGTSEDYKDITFCGITPQLAVAIWLGDPTNKVALPDHTSADDVFRRFASAALSGKPLQDFANAADPPYKTYSDPKYHVGGGGYGGGSNSGSQNGSNSDSGTSHNNGGSANNTQPDTTTKPEGGGGSSGGGTPPGGDQPGGDKPGGGGDAPGGDKPGGGDQPGGGGGQPPGGGGTGGGTKPAS